MILKKFRGIKPKIHPTARAGEDVVILGDVTMEENSSLWFGVIARGDVAPIVVGANSNIQDGCLLHNRTGIPTIIGKNVTAGHGAIIELDEGEIQEAERFTPQADIPGAGGGYFLRIFRCPIPQRGYAEAGYIRKDGTWASLEYYRTGPG